LTATGITCGIAVHVFYSWIGVATLIASSGISVRHAEIARSAYLIWIGVSACFTIKYGSRQIKSRPETSCRITTRQAFSQRLFRQTCSIPRLVFFISLIQWS